MCGRKTMIFLKLVMQKPWKAAYITKIGTALFAMEVKQKRDKQEADMENASACIKLISWWKIMIGG